ncbi:MAG: hypothetical protein J7J98_02090 [candidate division Zixibacteria bacterium]|nr:hypothetical protein [candidate division Zixibacteria bacterium]
MRIHPRVIAVAVAAGLVTLMAQPLVATMPTTPQYFDYTLEPNSLPDKSGPIELVLTFKLKPQVDECDSVLVQIGAWKDLVYDGPAEFWVSLAETGEYSTTLSVIVPPNDTSAIKIWLGCRGRGQQGLTKTFITTGDSIAVLDYVPTSVPEPARPQRVIRRSPGQKPVVATKEQFIRIDGQDCIQYDEHTGLESSDLTTTYEDYMGATTSFLETVPAKKPFEVVIDLRDPDVESAVRGLITEMTATNLPGYFRARINKETGLALVERKVYFFRYTASRNPGRNQQPHQQPINPDDSGETEPQSDRKMKESGGDTRGEDSSPQAWPEGITLHHVDGELSPGEISTGQPITFYLRIYNHFFHMRHIVNGFRIYSPDGAEWGSIAGDTISLGWEGDFGGPPHMFDWFFINYGSATGSGSDTVGFSGWGGVDTQMPEYFDEISYTITIGPIDEMYAGRTICLDSSFFGLSGKWEWIDIIDMKHRPYWYGPHCFTIVSPTIEFSGYARYWDMNPEADSTLPIRNAVIEMLDYESDDPDNPELVATTTTDAYGYFSFPSVDNSDDPPDVTGLRDIFFRIHSENAAAESKVVNQESYWESNVGEDLPGGVYDTTLVVPKNPLNSGPFYSSDVVLDGYKFWTDLGLPTPNQVNVEHAAQYGTGYSPSSSAIVLDIRDLPDSSYPDTYDRDIILHEYGHHLEYEFDILDTTVSGADHRWNQTVSPVLAAHEGFAHFVSCFMRGNNELQNRYFDFADGWWYNVENGEWGLHRTGWPDTTYGSANHLDSTECRVAGILWDLYDSQDDNYSACYQTADNWPWTNTDDVLDSVQFDIATILNVLLTKNADDGYLADDINEFQEAWLNAPNSGRPSGMQDVYYEHGIACCVGKRGNANGLGGDTPTIGDVAVLIDHLFIYQTPLPACVEEANANGLLNSAGEKISIGDVTLLIEHLFINPTTPLVDCPCVP